MWGIEYWTKKEGKWKHEYTGVNTGVRHDGIHAMEREQVLRIWISLSANAGGVYTGESQLSQVMRVCTVRMECLKKHGFTIEKFRGWQ